MFCSKCGNQLADYARFCEICGTPVGSGSVKQPNNLAEQSTTSQAEKESASNDNSTTSNGTDVQHSVNNLDDIGLDKAVTTASVKDSETFPKKKNIKKFVIISIIAVALIVFVAEEIIVRYRRKVVDFYEIAHTMDRETFEKFFALVEDQSIPGSFSTYKLDDHHAYITFYEDSEQSVEVQFEDHGDDYEYRFHRMAGHKLFETPADFEKDSRFTELIRRENVVYFDDLDYEDAYLTLYIDEQDKAYNMVYKIEPGCDKMLDEMLVTTLAYPELNDNTTVSKAGKERADNSGIDISNIIAENEEYIDTTSNENTLDLKDVSDEIPDGYYESTWPNDYEVLSITKYGEQFYVIRTNMQGQIADGYVKASRDENNIPILEFNTSGIDFKYTYHKNDNYYSDQWGRTFWPISSDEYYYFIDMTDPYAGEGDPGDTTDTNTLIDDICMYYAASHATNSVKGEVSSIYENEITIRLYDPDPLVNTTSNTLGFYSYNTETGEWKDAVMGEVIDIHDWSSFEDEYNQMLAARSGYPE